MRSKTLSILIVLTMLVAPARGLRPDAGAQTIIQTVEVETEKEVTVVETVEVEVEESLSSRP